MQEAQIDCAEGVSILEKEREGLEWQVGVWNRISDIYQKEIDHRFSSVVENVVQRANLKPGQQVLDLGTGTGAVAERAAQMVGPKGRVVGTDISPEMLALAKGRMAARGITNAGFRESRAEELSFEDKSFDVVLASLVFMYVINRAAAAKEIARVLRPKGRLVAAVWAGADLCDIVLFQETAGRFAPTPPVSGVGPGVLADPTPFVKELENAGFSVKVEMETLGFDFDNFASAWDALAKVTTAKLEPERRKEAKKAVLAAVYPTGDGPRHFRNVTQFIVGQLN